jgi:hypothetical protein
MGLDMVRVYYVKPNILPQSANNFEVIDEKNLHPSV